MNRTCKDVGFARIEIDDDGVLRSKGIVLVVHLLVEDLSNYFSLIEKGFVNNLQLLVFMIFVMFLL